jgi:SPP1 gp7 family putative phage head morphogenesis protein
MNQFDRAVEFQLDLQRVTKSLQADAIRILQRLERELVAEVSAGRYTQWRKARVDAQLKEIRASIAEYYAQASAATAESAGSVATIAARSTALGMGAAANLPSTEVISSIMGRAIVQGAPMAAWWEKQAGDVAFNFAAAVRQGIVAAETNQQIVKRVLDVMTVSKANAAALVQTTVATVSTDAAKAVAAQNADIIKRIRAVETLDSRTCLRCMPLDGLEWEPDGTPIGHNVPLPSWPIHYNCRGLALYRITDEPPGGSRATGDGQVAAKTTFNDWLDRQSKAKQEEILGQGRADLYRSGKITLSDLTSGTGRPLTIKQLNDKYNRED